MYKDEIGQAVRKEITIQADSGFQGIKEFHANSEIPKKKPKGGSLTKDEKTNNRRISRERILIENINAKLKVFKILANKYRNRRLRYGLRMALICSIYNSELHC
jgi:transposase